MTLFEIESTLTDRYQTTVPEPVRLVLKLGKRDKLRYAVRSDGTVVMTRAPQTEETDPVLEQFLGFMARDLAEHPERVCSIDSGLLERLHALVGAVEVDLDEPLAAADE